MITYIIRKTKVSRSATKFSGSSEPAGALRLRHPCPQLLQGHISRRTMGILPQSEEVTPRSMSKILCLSGECKYHGDICRVVMITCRITSFPAQHCRGMRELQNALMMRENNERNRPARMKGIAAVQKYSPS